MLSKNPKETEKIAKIFLDEILQNKKKQNGALVVCLSGNLGAGKTAFMQAIGKHLGVKNKISSPTFVLIKKYPIGKTYGVKFLFHLDAYRLKNEKELLSLGWEEIIGNKEHLVFIEWPENVKKVIPDDARFVYISHGKNDTHRNLKFK
ncbi:MAG: tRNA (adenosine(37)-N6)-threonylcarbamoyltransferase complex ATPase subunit type 1 TsaE [Minisyncoccia bacterium]